MQVLSRCPLRVGSVLWLPRPGAYAMTIVCKATFRLAPELSPLAEAQEPVTEADVYPDGDEGRALLLPSDLVPFKRQPEVLLVGHAYAPGGAHVGRLIARLTVVEVDKLIEVTGDRHFKLDGSLSHPARFTKMPLVWERAAGGPETSNPAGVVTGPEARADGWGRVPVPNLVPQDRLVADRDDVVPPACFAPIAPHWPLRVARLHRYAAAHSHRAWNARPLPPDIDPGYFNCAPPDQQVHELLGTERLTLENLHPEHALLATQLQGVRPRAHVDWGGGAVFEIALVCDTLLIDTDRGVACVTFRGSLSLDHPERDGRIVVTMDGYPAHEPPRPPSRPPAPPKPPSQAPPKPSSQVPPPRPSQAPPPPPRASQIARAPLPSVSEARPGPSVRAPLPPPPPEAWPSQGQRSPAPPPVVGRPVAVSAGPIAPPQASSPDLPAWVHGVKEVHETVAFDGDDAPAAALPFQGDPADLDFGHAGDLDDEETFASDHVRAAPAPPPAVQGGAPVPVPPVVKAGPRLGAFRLASPADAAPATGAPRTEIEDAPTMDPDDAWLHETADEPGAARSPAPAGGAGAMGRPGVHTGAVGAGPGVPGGVDPARTTGGFAASTAQGAGAPRSPGVHTGTAGGVPGVHMGAAGGVPGAPASVAAPPGVPVPPVPGAPRPPVPGTVAPPLPGVVPPVPVTAVGAMPAVPGTVVPRSSGGAVPVPPVPGVVPPVPGVVPPVPGVVPPVPVTVMPVPGAPPPVPGAMRPVPATVMPSAVSLPPLPDVAPAGKHPARPTTRPDLTPAGGGGGLPFSPAPGEPSRRGHGEVADRTALPFAAVAEGASARAGSSPALPFAAVAEGTSSRMTAPPAMPFVDGAPARATVPSAVPFTGAAEGAPARATVPALPFAGAAESAQARGTRPSALPFAGAEGAPGLPFASAQGSPAPGMTIGEMAARAPAPVASPAPVGAIDFEAEPTMDALPEEAAPPARLGPLATPEMVAADLGVAAAPAPEAAPPAAPSGDAAAPEAAGPPPLPIEEYPIDRCARIGASIARSRDRTAEILRSHELQAQVWEALKAHWSAEIKKETERGKTALLRAYDAAYVAQLEDERGPIAVEEYARLMVASERGTTGQVLGELHLPEGATLRIQRVWMGKMQKDAELRRLVRSAVEAESEG